MGTRWSLPSPAVTGQLESEPPVGGDGVAWPRVAPPGVPASSTPGGVSVSRSTFRAGGPQHSTPVRARDEPQPKPVPGAKLASGGRSWDCRWCPECRTRWWPPAPEDVDSRAEPARTSWRLTASYPGWEQPFVQTTIAPGVSLVPQGPQLTLGGVCPLNSNLRA